MSEPNKNVLNLLILKTMNWLAGDYSIIEHRVNEMENGNLDIEARDTTLSGSLAYKIQYVGHNEVPGLVMFFSKDHPVKSLETGVELAELFDVISAINHSLPRKRLSKEYKALLNSAKFFELALLLDRTSMAPEELERRLEKIANVSNKTIDNILDLVFSEGLTKVIITDKGFACYQDDTEQPSGLLFNAANDSLVISQFGGCELKSEVEDIINSNIIKELKAEEEPTMEPVDWFAAIKQYKIDLTVITEKLGELLDKTVRLPWQLNWVNGFGEQPVPLFHIWSPSGMGWQELIIIEKDKQFFIMAKPVKPGVRLPNIFNRVEDLAYLYSFGAYSFNVEALLSSIQRFLTNPNIALNRGTETTACNVMGGLNFGAM